MNNKTIIKYFLIGLFIFGFSSHSYAESYWSIGAGNASIDLKPLFGTEELEDSTMIKVIIGHRTDNNGLELDISVGNFDWVNSSINSHTVAVVSGNLVRYLPLNDSIELFAKIGVNTSSTTVDYQGLLYEGDSGFGFAYGAGIDFRLTESFAFRAEYQGITGIDDGIDSGDLDWLSIQAVFGF